MTTHSDKLNTKNLFLVTGKPGSGKSTASESAARQLDNAYYFSIGDELRAIGLEGKDSHLSDEIVVYADVLKQHLPVPAHLAERVFEECIANNPNRIILVDGYPQYADRLPGFHSTLERVGARILAICEIGLTDELARVRLGGRDQRSNVAEDEDFISKRLSGYQKNVLPTIGALRGAHPLHVIDGSNPKEVVASDLVEIINSYR